MIFTEHVLVYCCHVSDFSYIVSFKINGSTYASNSNITLDKTGPHEIQCYSDANPQVTCTTSASCKDGLSGEVGCTPSVFYDPNKDEQCIFSCSVFYNTDEAKGELFILFA